MVLATALLLGAAPFARADIKLGQERFAGRGTRGPYAISRQAVEDRTEMVWVNGRRMMKGQDYVFDASMGALAFSESIGVGDSVEVDYQYDTAKAHAPTAIGGTFGLLNTANGGLALSYGFKPTSSGEQTLSSLGFSGQGSFLGSSLTSSFMVDKTAAANAGADAQNMSLNMKRDSGPFTFSLDYSNVGKKFSPADALKLVKGSEALNFTGSLQLAQNSALTFKKVDNATPDAKTGVVKNTSLVTGGLGLSLSGTTRLTALHEVQSEAQGKESKNSAIDRLQFDQKLGKNASALLLTETVTTGKNGASETVKATRASFAASGNHGLTFDTSLSLTDSSKTGSARDAVMKLAGGDGNTKMALAVTDRHADSGDVSTHALSINSNQGNGLTLAAALAGEKTDKGNHERASIEMAGGTSDRLRFNLGVANDSGVGKQGTSTKVSMASALANGLKFNLARSDDRTVKNGASSTKLAVDYTGSKTLKFSASQVADDNGTKTTGNTRMNLEAKPMENMTLVASRATDQTDKGDTSSTKVNVDANAGSTVKVAMTYTGDDNGKVSKEASGVKIVAAPNPGLKLTADVGKTNNELGDGQSKSVGLEANPNGGLSFAVTHSESSNNTGQSGANKVTFLAGGKINNISGSYGDAQTPTGVSSIKEATVNLVPVKNRLSVGGSFRDETKQNNTQVQIAMLQADVKPMDALAVTGYYKQRDTGTADQINTLNASVTLKPSDALQMVGTYSANPEEKDQVIRTVRKGLALQTHMGGLTFSGGYIQENSLLDTSEGTRAEFKLALRCNKYANLEGGFQQTIGSVRGFKPQLAYNVKYNHDIGSDFHLLLDANVVENDVTVPAAQRNDVKATANLGLRF